MVPQKESFMETRDFNHVLELLGMSIPVVVGETIDRTSTNLPALPGSVAAAKRLIADAIDVAALLDDSRDRERARNNFWNRLVRNPNDTPFITNIAFSGSYVYDKSGQIIIGLSIDQNVELPNGETVRVTPLIPTIVGVADVHYVHAFQQEGVDLPVLNSSGSFPCLVFVPKNNRNTYKAIPLGFADKGTIGTWNRIAREMPNKNWPEVIPIEHTLRKPGVRTVTLLPQYQEVRTYNNTRFRWEGKKKVSYTSEDKVTVIGSAYGMMLKLSPQSQPIPVDVVDGEACFTSKHVFRVKLGESALELTWLGREGEVTIDKHIPILDTHDEMDPFAVFGTSPNRVDVYTIDDTARGYLNSRYDENNPLFVAACDLGLVIDGDARHIVVTSLEDLMLRSIVMIKKQMSDSFERIKGWLTTSLVQKPSIDEVLQDRPFKAVLRGLNKPTDAAAMWIQSQIEGDFDPESPFHMHVREWLIKKIANDSGYWDRKKEEKSSVSVSEHHDVPVEVEVKVEETVPKKSKRSHKKKSTETTSVQV